jgi:hypothetical protein
MIADKGWTFADNGAQVGMGSAEIRVGVSQYDRAPRVLIVSYEGQVRRFTDGDVDHKVSPAANVEEVLRAFAPPDVVVVDRRILGQGCSGTPQCSAADTAGTSADTGVELIARLLKVLGTASRETKTNVHRE